MALMMITLHILSGLFRCLAIFGLCALVVVVIVGRFENLVRSSQVATRLEAEAGSKTSSETNGIE